MNCDVRARRDPRPRCTRHARHETPGEPSGISVVVSDTFLPFLCRNARGKKTLAKNPTNVCSVWVLHFSAPGHLGLPGPAPVTLLPWLPPPPSRVRARKRPAGVLRRGRLPQVVIAATCQNHVPAVGQFLQHLRILGAIHWYRSDGPELNICGLGTNSL
jgi:hypothetical protein